MSSTKFAEFLKEKKIDSRRILAVSHELERLTREDRAIKRARQNQQGDDKKKTAQEKKPHSGRPVTPRALAAALSGKAVSGPTKNRILRAVNKVMEQKKLGTAELSNLF